MALTNTDIRLQDEQNKIMENRSKLDIGKKYTYKKLVDILEIEYHKGGKSKIYQVQRIQKYIDWSKECGYIVKDNNKDIGMLDEVATKDKGSIYFNDFSHVLLYKLAEHMIECPSSKYIRLSRNYAIIFSELVNRNILIALDSQNRPFVPEVLNLSKIETNNYLNYIKNEALDIFIRSCKKLEKKGIIKLNSNLLVQRFTYEEYKEINGKCTYEEYLENGVEIATPDIVSDILTTESKVLKEMKLNSKYHVDVKHLWKEFKRRVCEYLDIENYWDNFDISLNRDDTSGVLAEFENTFNLSREQLKDSFSNMIKKSNSKQISKIKVEDRERLSDTFILNNNKRFASDVYAVKQYHKECIRAINDVFAK